jgi:inner membrane protein
MDPLSHTLTGAALGCTGLQERTRLARTTLIIGANLPDVDAVTYLVDGVDSLAIRRGVTHGVMAMVVLPVLLALTIKGVAMLRRRSDGTDGAPFRQLLLLAAIAVATHPVLDQLNNYGMRWLMPFVDRWWYGDTLYIVDPVVWAILLAGIVSFALLRPEPHRSRAAAGSLAVLALYIAASALGTAAARSAALAATGEEPPRRLMASPVLLRPLERELVLEYGDEYRFGRVELQPAPRVTFEAVTVPKGDPRDLEMARATEAGGIFLRWARFPFTEGADAGGLRIIRVMDARYVREWDDGFATVRVTVPAP